MLILHDMAVSGNCYKIRLLLAFLNIPFQSIAIEPSTGQSSTPAFLAKNPAGSVPFLEFENGQMLAESNAILIHLSEGTSYLPRDKFERAKAYQWLFFEQYSHEPNVAVRISLLTVPARAASATPERLNSLLTGGNKALRVMETQLSQTPFLTGSNFSIADIALYAYTHKAEKGGFNLEEFTAVNAWLDRVKAIPGFVPMDWLPTAS